MNRSISNRSSSRDRENGFTLIEILVAISILAIVLTSVYGIFTSVSSTRERLDADSAGYHKARVVFDRLGRELRGAYFHPDNRNLVLSGRSIDDSLELELTTTAFTPLSQTGTGFARVRYQLEIDREQEGNKFVLMRSERPAHETSDGEAAEMMRLIPGIKTMALRFLSNGQWQNSWDSHLSGTPDLVEITLQLWTEKEGVVSFVSTFDVPRLGVR